MALTISYNKTKGVYVDYDDDVIESSEWLSNNRRAHLYI
jgi:hypothetical protein